MFPTNHNYIFLSFHFRADTGPECWPISSPFFRFFSFTVFGQSFLLRCRVPTVSFQGLQSLNQSWWVIKIVHRQWAFFSNASTSENTNATILCHLKWMLFQIQCLCPHFKEAQLPQTGLTYFILCDSKFGSLWGYILYGRKSAPPPLRILVTQVLQYSAQVRTKSEHFVQIKQDGMDFVKSERSLTCFCILTPTQICEMADLFKPIHRNDTAPG